MILDQLRSRLTVAMKSGNELERNIIRLVIGEVNTLEANQPKPVTDEQVGKIVRKLMTSNEETLQYSSGERKELLEKENIILSEFVPKYLTQEQICEKLVPVQAAIKEAKSEGAAMGVAMKVFKQENLMVEGNDVKVVIHGLRS